MTITDGLGRTHKIRQGDEIFIDNKTLEVTVVPPERQYQARLLGIMSSKEFPLSYFEQAINKILEMHRKKSADYTDTREFGNFEEASQAAGIEVMQGIENLIGTKEARIRNLRKKGSNPVNEPLEDSYYDRAVYAVISYARFLYEKDNNTIAVAGNIGGLSLLTEKDFKTQPGGELLCAWCKHTWSAHQKSASDNGCKCCLRGHFESNK